MLLDELSQEENPIREKPSTKTSPVIIPIPGLDSPCLHTLLCHGKDSFSQTKERAWNSRFFAISNLPHGKQAHFACTSAVCLISDFHSDLEEKILSLDHSVSEWKMVAQRKT